MNQKEASGQGADSGAAFRKKFKRAVISGGSLRGARYSDLPDSDIRKYSKGYKGDPRFVQYCKQFVSSELVSESSAPVEAQDTSTLFLAEPKTSKKSMLWMEAFVNGLKNFVRDYCRGRWFSFGVLTCFLFIVITRPAFGRLCGRIFSLILRLCFRRVVGLLSVIIDSVLEETAVHLEEALTTSPETTSTRDTPNFVVQTSQNSFSQFLLNGLCVLLGSLLHRTFQRAAPAVHPTHP